MIYRVLGADDLAAWKDIRLEALSRHPECFLTTHAEELTRPTAQTIEFLSAGTAVAALEDEALCAVLSVDPETQPALAHRAWIHALFCRAQWRGGSVARELMDFAIAKARSEGLLQLELFVAAENARAIRLYERFGFQTCGRVPRAVRVSGRFQDDLHYWLPLDGETDPKG